MKCIVLNWLWALVLYGESSSRHLLWNEGQENLNSCQKWGSLVVGKGVGEMAAPPLLTDNQTVDRKHTLNKCRPTEKDIRQIWPTNPLRIWFFLSPLLKRLLQIFPHQLSWQSARPAFNGDCFIFQLERNMFMSRGQCFVKALSPTKEWQIQIYRHIKNKILVLGSYILVLGVKLKRGSILHIFQDRPMFSHILEMVSLRAFHWCG